jgi:hypothetical protein
VRDEAKYLHMLESLLGLSPSELRLQMDNSPTFHENLIVDLMKRLIEVLSEEDNVLILQSDIVVCGDIHGQLYDLFKLFNLSDEIPNSQYLFLGDYVDRGYQSIQTFVYLAYLKVKFPTRIFLLRGNHESRTINQTYGFQAECTRSYGHVGIWRIFNEAFDYLPVCAIIDHS